MKLNPSTIPFVSIKIIEYTSNPMFTKNDWLDVCNVHTCRCVDVCIDVCRCVYQLQAKCNYLHAIILWSQSFVSVGSTFSLFDTALSSTKFYTLHIFVSINKCQFINVN